MAASRAVAPARGELGVMLGHDGMLLLHLSQQRDGRAGGPWKTEAA